MTNQSKENDLLQLRVQTAQDAEERVERLRLELAEAEVAARDAWASAGRLAFNMARQAESEGVKQVEPEEEEEKQPEPEEEEEKQPEPEEAKRAERLPSAESRDDLAGRCYDILNRNGAPMLLSQIRHQILKEVDPKRRKRLSLSVLRRKLLVAMGGKPLVFKQVGGRHWALHSSWYETFEPTLEEPAETEEDSTPCDRQLLQACVQILRAAPKPLSTESILAAILTKHPAQVADCPVADLWDTLLRLLPRKRVFQQTRSGDWALRPEDQSEARPPLPALTRVICEVLRRHPQPLFVVDLLSRLSDHVLKNIGSTDRARYQRVWLHLKQNPRVFVQHGSRGAWGLVDADTEPPLPALLPPVVSERKDLRPDSLAGLCFNVLVSSPEPRTARELRRIMRAHYPLQMKKYSHVYLKSGVCKAMARKPSVFKRLADDTWMVVPEAAS